MARTEADGPLAEHLQAIGNDECIYDDRDVYAVLEAASLITELEAENERLRSMLSRVPVVSPCEVNAPPPRCGRCDACRELHALDGEVKAWDDNVPA